MQIAKIELQRELSSGSQTGLLKPTRMPVIWNKLSSIVSSKDSGLPLHSRADSGCLSTVRLVQAVLAHHIRVCFGFTFVKPELLLSRPSAHIPSAGLNDGEQYAYAGGSHFCLHTPGLQPMSVLKCWFPLVAAWACLCLKLSGFYNFNHKISVNLWSDWNWAQHLKCHQNNLKMLELLE